MLLPVSPDIFDRIEFRRVGGEPFQRDATPLIRHELLDQSATVSREPIPNDEKIAREVAHQVAQEFHHLRAFDRSWVQAEVEGPPRNARDDGERAPVEVVLENRSLASGSPASTTVGPLAQSALVDEDDRLPSTPRVFLAPASAHVSSAGWPLHRVRWPDPLAAVDSNPARARSATLATSCTIRRTSVRSDLPHGVSSIGRCRIPVPPDRA